MRAVKKILIGSSFLAAAASAFTADAALDPPPPGDHYMCYVVARAPGQGTFRAPAPPTLVDPYGTVTAHLNRVARLCTPAQVNDAAGEPVRPDAHEVVYSLNARPASAPHADLFFDEFVPGGRQVILARRTELLVPAGKSLDPAVTPPIATGIDHYVCNSISPAFIKKAVVKVTDQFATQMLSMRRVVEVCTPADKNGEDPDAPTHLGNLVCYDARPLTAHFASRTVRVQDQFAARSLVVQDSPELCVPAYRGAVPRTTTTSTSTTTTTSTTLAPEPGPAVRFTTTVASGVCGVVHDAANQPLLNLQCAALYLGGGTALVPPGINPDGATNRFLVTGCNGNVCTLGPAAGSSPDFDCSTTGCFFGPPLPIANAGLSACVLNTFGSPGGGTLDLSTGEVTLQVPLSSKVWVTGAPASPCPTCRVGSPSGPVCAGTPASPCTGVCANTGSACRTTNSNGLSLDCQPTLMPVGTIPVDLTPLGSGVSSKASANGVFCPSQRTPGCFIQQNCREFEEQGTPAGPITPNVPASLTLSTTFCVGDTGSPILNLGSDLPGPGATTLPGKILYEP